MKTAVIRGHRILSMVVCLAISCPLHAFAGRDSVPCDRPFVFRDAAVNLVVLPYSNLTEYGTQLPLDRVGRQIPLLIQANGLFLMLKYASVGSVNLIAREAAPQCSEEVVLSQLLEQQPGAQAVVAPGHGLILVWGTIYTEGGQTFIQTYLRFLRRGLQEEFRARIGDQEFVSNLAGQAVTFAPRILTSEDLDKIEKAFRQAITAHEGPGPQFPVIDLHLYDPKGFQHSGRRHQGYHVLDQKRDWMLVETDSGSRGWIRANASIGSTRLSDWLPEMHFIDLTACYLQSMVNQSKSAQAFGQAKAALEVYLSRSGNDVAPLTAAVAEQMVGILAARADSVRNLTYADSLFSEAAKMLPSSPNARVLAALASFQSQTSGDSYPADAAGLERQLSTAFALDPRDSTAYKNIVGFYDYLGKQSPRFGTNDLPPERINQRLKMLRGIKPGTVDH